jgi:hypothetical protein
VVVRLAEGKLVGDFLLITICTNAFQWA